MPAVSSFRLAASVEASMLLADRLFRELRSRTRDGPGVSRAPYAAAEQAAHDLLAEAGRALDLEITVDPFGNLYMTLPGRDRAAPRWIAGSHLDSVPCAGNYDGAAGVVAGITALAAFRKCGFVPARDISVMGIRAEEVSSWFSGNHNGHFGCRSALGRLPREELLSAVNAATGATLAAQMKQAGFEPDLVGRSTPWLQPSAIHGYLELHIEQGPVLEQRGIPVGVVTAIRGAARARNARCLGAYTHSGAVPHEYRADAVLATAELLHELDLAWARIRAEGGDLVFTVGKLYTDARLHALTKVPGETRFTIDFRSQDEALLRRMGSLAHQLAAEIGARRRVRLELGEFDLHEPATMDAGYREVLNAGCRELGITAMDIPSGAGHDAQDFALAGVRAAMIFVRNSHGSHNPDEAMDMNDFKLGTQLLAWMLARET
jgi:N-carbamoyl-L-amino-acid hydrolase